MAEVMQLFWLAYYKAALRADCPTSLIDLTIVNR